MTLAARPGSNLLRLLELHGRELAEFAVAAEMGAKPRHALANLRQYTHGSKRPSAGMVDRWAAVLGVDPGEFYKP